MNNEEFKDRIIAEHGGVADDTTPLFGGSAFVFVYFNDGVIKVLDLEAAKRNNVQLMAEGWKHTATLDACRFIEYLFNQAEEVDVYAAVKELSNAYGVPACGG